jgi:phosphoenolpyruvate-protein kinase (PTS system EI component)
MPTITKAQQRAYARRLRQISRNFDRLERETLQQSISLLRDVRDRLAGQLTGSEFSQFRIAEQQQAIDDIIASYEAQARAMTNGAVRQGFVLGEQSAVLPQRRLRCWPSSARI